MLLPGYLLGQSGSFEEGKDMYTKGKGALISFKYSSTQSSWLPFSGYIHKLDFGRPNSSGEPFKPI